MRFRAFLALVVLTLFSADQLLATTGPAQILSPAPGSTFTSSTVTFSWSAGSATAYWLLVGSSQYGYDIYNSAHVHVLSPTVNNMPTPQPTLYMTLVSQPPH